MEFLLGHPLVATKKLRRRRLPCIVIISGARLPDRSCFPPHDGTIRDGVEFDVGQAEALYLLFAQHILVLFRPFRQPEDLYGDGGAAVPLVGQAVADARWTEAFEAFDASSVMGVGTPGRRYMLYGQDYYVVQEEANRKAREAREAIAAAYPPTGTAAADTLYAGDRGDDDDAEDGGGGGQRDAPDPSDEGLYAAEARQLILSEMFAAQDELDLKSGKGQAGGGGGGGHGSPWDRCLLYRRRSAAQGMGCSTS